MELDWNLLLTGAGTILGTAILFVLRDYRDGKHVFKKNGTAESVKILREMLSIQQGLKAHYNDETTEILKEIRDGQKECSKTAHAILTRQEEMMKYGVPLLK